MSYEKIKTPYELLVRFDDKGDFQGAHCVHLETLIVDGEKLNTKILDAAQYQLIVRSSGKLKNTLTLLLIDNLNRLVIQLIRYKLRIQIIKSL